MGRWRVGVIMGAWLAVVAAAGAAFAQENFPNRPIRIVIPYSAGSVADRADPTDSRPSLEGTTHARSSA